MSKADDFAKLSHQAAQGEWTHNPTPPLRYDSGPATGFSRYDLICATDRSCKIYRCTENSGESGWSPYFTMQFLIWCANNRERLLRGLRLLEETEKQT